MDSITKEGNENFELNLDQVKKKAVRGVAVLTGRTFILNILSLIAIGFLTVFLQPSELGVFWIVSAIVNFLTYFSDIGLAAALIQKKEKIIQEELSTTFFIQQILVILLLIILYCVSPFLREYYGFSNEAQMLLFALGFSFLLSSLKTIPSVLIERSLEFEKLVFPQVLENLFYNLSAVYFAWRGFGITSFTYAVIIRGIVGFVVIYILKPWKPSLIFSKVHIKRLLKFGVPYQANTFLAVIKDDGLTAFLGGILGATGLGYLGWAQKWAYMPLRFFMDNVLKVTFPAFARMQENKEELQNAVTRSIFFVCFLVFPTVIGLIIITPKMINIIPRYEKWWPAYLPLILISINTIFASATTQLTNLLNAIGEIKTTFKLMVMWTTLTWILVPYLSIKYSFLGASFGYAIVGLSSVVAIYIAHKKVNFSLVDSILKPLITSLIMGLIVYIISVFVGDTKTSVIFLFSIGLIVYIITSYFIIGGQLLNDSKKILLSFLRR